MERIIDDCLGSGAVVIVLHHLAHTLSLLLGRERHDGRGTTERCRHTTAVEIISRLHSHTGLLLDMTVAVDASRHDQPARGIHLFVSRADFIGQGHDLAVTNTDVADHAVSGGHHRAIANGQVQICHEHS